MNLPGRILPCEIHRHRPRNFLGTRFMRLATVGGRGRQRGTSSELKRWIQRLDGRRHGGPGRRACLWCRAGSNALQVHRPGRFHNDPVRSMPAKQSYRMGATGRAQPPTGQRPGAAAGRACAQTGRSAPSDLPVTPRQRGAQARTLQPRQTDCGCRARSQLADNHL